jgi:hypothetical protein
MMTNRDLETILQQEFSLPYLPGITGGLDAIFLGAFPLLQKDPELQSRIASELDPRKLHRLPLRYIDPIGFLFAEKSVCLRNELIDKLKTATTCKERMRILSSAPWNAFHLGLFYSSLEYISATCIDSLVDGINDFSDDASLLFRLKEQAEHLYIAPDPDPALLQLSEQILRSEAEKRLKAISRYHRNKNWHKPHVSHRTRKGVTVLQDGIVSVERKLQLPSKARIRLKKAARQEELEDEASRKQAEIEAAAIDQSLGARQKACRLPFLSLSALPFRGGLTESGLSVMRAWVKSNWQTNPSALLLALVDIAYLADESFSGARVEWHGAAAYLVTPCPYLTATATSPELHLGVAEEFWRPIPPELATATQDLLRRHDREKLLTDRDILLRDRFDTSYAKMKAALRYNAPIWDDISWMGSEFGLNPVRFDAKGKPKMPGYRSYLVWDPSVHEARSIASLSMRGWDIAPDPKINMIPRCGSRNCPRPAMISEIVTALELLIAQGNNQLPNNYRDAAPLMNAIAALTRLLELLLIFGRNYPSDAPLAFRIKGKYELLNHLQIREEKIRPRPLFYGSELRALMGAVAGVFQSFFSSFEQQGFEFIRLGEKKATLDMYCYSFLPRNVSGKSVALQHPRKSLIADGLLHHPETEYLGQLALNGMRNLDYYLLTANPEYDRVVMDLCDHYPTGGKGATYRGSAANFASQEIRQKASSFLLHNISWPWH